MAQTSIILEVEVRDRTGKGGAREARRLGYVPGVLYGGDRGPVAINLKFKEVMKAINSGKFLSHLVTITHKGEPQTVIPQAVQFHPVSDMPLHIDLYRVEETQLIKVDVPVHFKGEDVSPGLKRGGTLNVVRHTVELLVPANAIPEFLEGDVSALKIGDVLKISMIPLPAGAKPTIQDRDFTVATIASPGGSQADDDAAEPAAG
jgi:large subunit ribosomal protein L25